MCGIVGMAGKLTAQHKDIMSAMLTVCSLRGMHSTGTFIVKEKANNVTVNKTVGPPIELFNTVGYDRLSSYNASVFGGHCRAATHGAINRRNAHPFENDRIVGMHNGTLENWRGSLKDASFFDVDSECLMHNIAEFGVEEVIPKVRGAYALVWFDKEEGTLNFLRNSKRPLWFCMTEDNEVMFWASEYWMLDMLRSDHGKRQKFAEDKDENLYYELEEDVLIRYRINTSPIKDKEKVFTMLSRKNLEGDSSQPTYSPPFQGGYTRRTWQETQNLLSPPATQTPMSQRWGPETDAHWDKIWGDEEWNDLNKETPPLVIDPKQVKEEAKGLIQRFQDKVSGITRVTQLPPIPQRATVVTTVAGKTNTLTSGTKPTDTASSKASSKETTSSKGSQTRRTSSLTLVSDNKESSLPSSKKLTDLFVTVETPTHPIEKKDGKFWTFTEFAKHTGGCCASCDHVLTNDEFHKENTTIGWLTSDSFLCSDCNTIPLEQKAI